MQLGSKFLKDFFITWPASGELTLCDLAAELADGQDSPMGDSKFIAKFEFAPAIKILAPSGGN